MKYRTLGQNLKVSPIGCGFMTMDDSAAAVDLELNLVAMASAAPKGDTAGQHYGEAGIRRVRL
jgi:aryl-alcohol dehydrogenase-like predicted oxidoreductase